METVTAVLLREDGGFLTQQEVVPVHQRQEVVPVHQRQEALPPLHAQRF